METQQDKFIWDVRNPTRLNPLYFKIWWCSKIYKWKTGEIQSEFNVDLRMINRVLRYADNVIYNDYPRLYVLSLKEEENYEFD